MKLITSSHGTVALHVSGDDVVPKHGVITRDLIDFLMNTYQFSVGPSLPEGIPPAAIQAFHFQSGVMMVEDERNPIIQLSIVQNGDIVTAPTTDIADIVLDDLIKHLDEKFGYRYATSKQRRSYLSNIVVQFDVEIDEKIKFLVKIETLLNREIPRKTSPFKIKRLAFGHGDIAQLYVMPLSVDAVENSDFLIERRSTAPYSENRYFSSAPAKTEDHFKILEMIEHEVGAN